MLLANQIWSPKSLQQICFSRFADLLVTFLDVKKHQWKKAEFLMLGNPRHAGIGKSRQGSRKNLLELGKSGQGSRKYRPFSILLMDCLFPYSGCFVWIVGILCNLVLVTNVCVSVRSIQLHTHINSPIVCLWNASYL